MRFLSESSSRALQGILGREEAPAQNAPAQITYTLVKVRDPLEDIEALVDAMDAPQHRRRPNSWLRKQRGGGHTGISATIGRRCCLSMTLGLEHRLTVLPLGGEHTCPECGTVWRLDLALKPGAV